MYIGQIYVYDVYTVDSIHIHTTSVLHSKPVSLKLLRFTYLYVFSVGFVKRMDPTLLIYSVELTIVQLLRVK